MRSARKGFSLLEILVATLLSAGLGLAVATAVSSASKVAKVSLSKASSEQQIRDVLQVASRYIKAARPQGGCLSTGLNSTIVYTVRLDQCPVMQVRDDPNGPVIYADFKKLELYSYWKDCADPNGNCQQSSANLEAPVKLLLEVSEIVDPGKTYPGQILRVSLTKATNASTFTNPDFTGQQPTVIREVVLLRPSNSCPPSPSGGCLPYPSETSPFFTYYASSGSQTADITQVALIRMNPKVWVQMDRSAANEWKEYGYPVYVPIAYRGFSL